MKYYAYKNHLYIIVRNVRLKDSAKGWVDAVEYQRADNPRDAEKRQMFIRSQADFDENFIPMEIERAFLSVDTNLNSK